MANETLLPRIHTLINDRLQDIEDGYATASLEDLLRLKAAAEKDQPVAMMFLLVINRQLAFLQQTITDPAALQIISTFLQSFQAAIEADLFTLMSGLKTGLALIPPEGASESRP